MGRQDQGIFRDGYNAARPTGGGFAGRKVRPMSNRRSDFITTRCYSPAGVQLWDGDHGNDPYAIAVGADGTIYQSGKEASSAYGDSLFHRAADGNCPIVTAMVPGGAPIWSIKRNFGNTEYSLGLAVTGDYVYCGFNTPPSTAHIAKLAKSSGGDTLHLPQSGFGFEAGFIAPTLWGRVRCDGSGNVYATAGKRPVKWVSDAEYWIFHEQFDNYYEGTGLDVSTDGRVFTSSSPDPQGSLRTPLFYIADTSVSNVSPAAYSPYLAKVLKPGDADPGWPLPFGVGGYNQTGCSPSGLCVTHDDMNGKIQSVTATADPDIPTVTEKNNVGTIGGVFGTPYTAMAINDSGLYCYSVPRVAGPGASSTFYIRAADGTAIVSPDTGGGVTDAAVLPNGNVIVCHQRVPRADFP